MPPDVSEVRISREEIYGLPDETPTLREGPGMSKGGRPSSPRFREGWMWSSASSRRGRRSTLPARRGGRGDQPPEVLLLQADAPGRLHKQVFIFKCLYTGTLRPDFAEVNTE